MSDRRKRTKPVEPTAEAVPETPVEIVAAKIAERLVSDGLLRSRDLAACRDKLIRGATRRSDWRLWVENALEEAAR